MRIETDPQKIRRKVYLTYFKDGLWDIALGLFLLGWGFTVWFDLPWLPGAVFVSFFWLVMDLKKKITYPRIGLATPTEQRNRAIKIAIAGIVILLAIIVLLPLINSEKVRWLHDYFEFLFGSAIAIAIGIVGYWWKIYRWYLYAIMLFIPFVFYQWNDLSFSLSFIIPGGIITLCGLTILSHFLRKYPIVSEEDLDETR